MICALCLVIFLGCAPRFKEVFLDTHYNIGYENGLSANRVGNLFTLPVTLGWRTVELPVINIGGILLGYATRFADSPLSLSLLRLHLYGMCRLIHRCSQSRQQPRADIIENCQTCQYEQRSEHKWRIVVV